MTIRKDHDLYRWEVEFLDGSQKEIVVNRKNSNTY